MIKKTRESPIDTMQVMGSILLWIPRKLGNLGTVSDGYMFRKGKGRASLKFSNEQISDFSWTF